MSFRQAGAELARDVQRFLLAELAGSLQTRRQSLAFEKLHGQKVELTQLRMCRVNFIYQADVWVPHIERAFKLGRQQTLETRFGRFDRDPLFALSVESLVYNAHSPIADFTHNLETLRDDLSGLKRASEILESDHGLQQEVAHRSSQATVSATSCRRSVSFSQASRT